MSKWTSKWVKTRHLIILVRLNWMVNFMFLGESTHKVPRSVSWLNRKSTGNGPEVNLISCSDVKNKRMWIDKNWRFGFWIRWRCMRNIQFSWGKNHAMFCIFWEPEMCQVNYICYVRGSLILWAPSDKTEHFFNSAMMEPLQKRMHQQHTVTIQRHWVTLKVLRLLLEVGMNPTIERKYLILQIINGQRLLITHIIKCK